MASSSSRAAGVLDHFAISAISSPAKVGTPFTIVTITAQDASNNTVTSFTSTVTFGGTAGVTVTSAEYLLSNGNYTWNAFGAGGTISSAFTAGVLNNASLTPSVVGGNLTVTVSDGTGHTGSAAIATVSAFAGTAGQIKPTGTPEINRAHSLAQGLLFYGIDTGNNSIVNLCPGNIIQYGATAVDGICTLPASASSSFGTATFWPGGPFQGSPGVNDNGAYAYTNGVIPPGQLFSYWHNASDGYSLGYNPTELADNLSNKPAGAGYSFTCAYVQTGDNTYGMPFGRPQEADEISPYINWMFKNSNAHPWEMDCSVLTTNGPVSIPWVPAGGNQFNVVVGVVQNTAAGVGTLSYYANGQLVATIPNITTTEYGNGALGENQIMFGTIYHVGTTVAWSPFLGYVYFGAFWNRPLASDEVSQLYNNPYTFLAFPSGVDHFAISTILSPKTAGTSFTIGTITAQDASNNTVIGFNGTVTFGGTAGVTGTSGTFTSGVLSNASVTPTVAGSNLTVTVSDGAGHTGSATIATVASVPSAIYVRTDTTTQGRWKGVYGADGYNVIADTVNYPAFATVTPSGYLNYTWTSSSSDVRALEKAGSADKIAACWYSGDTFYIDINLTDGQTHRIGLYMLDWDHFGPRAETLTFLNPANGAQLDSQPIASFGSGQYLVWDVTGHVQVRITKSAGNAVVSGIFFGALDPLPPADASSITLDGSQEGRTFEGLGALSAGGSSRLLIEYPEPQRSQILDYLFKPNYGASMQHLKVEVPGDINGGCATEPSHMHTRTDENYTRGYEWWLMEEAKKRNPGIKLEILPWGAPGWIGNGTYYSQDMADYLVKFIKGAKQVHNLDIDYVGIWNETPYNIAYIKLLRQTLNTAGLQAVQIDAADQTNGGRWNIADDMAADPALAAAISVVGAHYPGYQSTAAAQICGKPIWCSEDGPWNGTWNPGAVTLAKDFNRNYITGRMTKTVIWSVITSYYDNLPLPGSGLMRANTPWSGNYDAQPALWAMAHTTQFAQPGWKYLDSGSVLITNGSAAALKSPNNSDYSVIIETVDASSPQQLTFHLAGGLSTGPLHVWRSDANGQFISKPDVTPVSGTFSIIVDGGCIYSLTTTTGQSKGTAAPPTASPLPLPYTENFESYALGGMPRYFADQGGGFEVVARTGGGKSLRQVIPSKGIDWIYHRDPEPETFMGELTWKDYDVSADALTEAAGYVSIYGRVGTVPQTSAQPKGYCLRAHDTGAWELRTDAAVITSGTVSFSVNTWHNLKLSFRGYTITALIDGATVASITDQTFTSGMMGVGSGWHGAQFDNISVQAAPPPLNVACVGDSITQGAGASNAATTSYPPDLQGQLGSTYQVTNFGRGGTTMLSLGDFPYVTTPEYTSSSNSNPNIVVIMLGTNDTKSQNWQYSSSFETDTTNMINHYANLLSHPQVYLCTICPAIGSGNFGITEPVVLQVIPHLQAVAIATSTPQIYVNTSMSAAPASDFPDNIHPNDAGYVILANTVYEVLRMAKPDSLTVAPVSTTQVTLNWSNHAVNATEVRIERKLGVNGAFSQITSVAANVKTYSDFGLSPGTAYYYRIRAANASGETPFSNTATATTLPVAPTITPSGGDILKAMPITLTAAGGLTIRYTLDGSTPTTAHGSIYSVPITTLAASATLKAIAYSASVSASAVASAAFTYWDFEPYTFTDANGTLPYRLFRPRNYNPALKYPLVLFLHGAGERGTNNTSQLLAWPGCMAFVNAANRVSHPCFMVAPQCPLDPERWVDNAAYIIGGQYYSYNLDLVPEANQILTVQGLIDHLKATFSIDDDRLYTTGLSMGGMGSWDLLMRHPRLFAAAIPMSGCADPGKAGNMFNVPVWNFHGATDTLVLAQDSRDMVNAMLAAGSGADSFGVRLPRYTEYPGGHGDWTNQYTNVLDMSWVFAQSRTPRPVIAPNGGAITTQTLISLTCAVSGATIRYTLDGSEPSRSNGFSYGAPFKLDANTTLKVFAYLAANNRTDSATASAAFAVQKAVPSIVWNTPADITYGVALDDVQLNAVAETPGTYAYTPPLGTFLNVGNGQTLSLAFSPTDTGTYVSASATVKLNVLKAAATVELSGLAQTYDGASKVASATTTPLSLNVDVTYDGLPTAPANAGDYAVVATINELNYQGTAAGTLAIDKAAADVALSGLTQTYNGAPKLVTVTTMPPGLNVDVTYDSLQTAPTNAGDYAVAATINELNYQGNTAGTLTIAKADQSITFDALADKYAYDPPFVVSASASSGLTVSFSIVSGPATIIGGNTVTLTGAGTVVVRASQAGGSNYNAALDNDRAFESKPNHPPVFSSPPTALPGATGVGQRILFSAMATDPDAGDTLTYSWDFGAGLVVETAAATQIFTVPGTHTVALTVSDNHGGVVTASVTVTVLAPLYGTGSDRDGDGFSDALEVAAHTDPANATSTPFGSTPAPAPIPLMLSGLAIKLNFMAANADSLALAGVLPLADGHPQTGEQAVLVVGSFLQAFVLDPHGKSSPVGFTMNSKARNGSTKFKIKLTHAELKAFLADLGFTSTALPRTKAAVPVALLIRGAGYQASRNLLFSQSRGKTGSTRPAQ